uniref:metalloproteinase inhibitor 2-like n=1 Tax=Doryrhamphus excisus TaxID=161450 RepID=UPI0025ADA307|nr:metalloproteinase inhibitor 2-like [Doryrhamphus excisus]
MMSWTMKTLVLPMVLLCVWRLQEEAEACRCFPEHPQTAFCKADIVIKAKVLGMELLSEHERKYLIKQTKMFKGDHRDIDGVYTAVSPSACGVTLTIGVEYLLSGRLTPEGLMHVVICDFIDPWNSLTANQKSNLVHNYQNGCNCEITSCHTPPCRSRPFECSWTDVVSSWYNGPQANNFACLKRGGSCGWVRGIH